MEDWDIESYRAFYESDEHWALKKEFMETHYHALSEERLICLAQVYANIELLGCRYPEKVMEEVSYLARGIGLNYKEQKKTKLQRTFVKASDAAGAKVRAPKGQKRKNPNERASHEPLSKKPVAFVKAESTPNERASHEPLANKMLSFVKSESVPDEHASHEPLYKKMPSFVKSESVPDERASDGPLYKKMPFVKSESVLDERASDEPLYKKMAAFDKAESGQDQDMFTGRMHFAMSENTSDKPASNQIMSFIKAVRDDGPDEEKTSSDTNANDLVSADKCMSFIKSLRGVGEPSEEAASGGSRFSNQREKEAQQLKPAAQKPVRQRITFPQEVGNDSRIGGGNFRQRITFPQEEENDGRIGGGNFRSPRGKGASAGGHSKDRGKRSAQLEALMRSNDPLCDFILVQRIYSNTDNPAAILEQSANFSHMPCDWSYDQHGSRCFLKINGIHVATAVSDSKKGAKEAAAVEALEILLERCFTLRVMKLHSSSEEISLDEVSDGSASSKLTAKHGSSLDTPIADTSIGSKLLKMMGWGGGGLGKDGSGISEPIKPAHVFGRSGLGHEGEQGVTKMFRSKIRSMLQDYLRGQDMEDLAFSPLFSKEQRAEIHKMARQMKLKSHSHGKGDNRFLVLSRKFSPKQLLYRLLQEGPTDKYVIIPPGEN